MGRIAAGWPGDRHPLVSLVGRVAGRHGRTDGADPGLATGLLRAFAEDATLDLAAVVLERVVEVQDGGVGRRVRQAVADRAIDRVMFFDGLGGVSSYPADADQAGLPLQPSCLA